jgi:hypothetical protein
LWMAPDLLQIFLVMSDKSRMCAEKTPEREGVRQRAGEGRGRRQDA